MSAEQAVVPAPPPPIWSSIREALRGSHQDFTRGSIHRAILLLAIPMILEMVLESLFAVVDVFWVGRLGADAVATVGLTESLLSLVFAIGLGLSLSTTFRGAGDAAIAMRLLWVSNIINLVLDPCLIFGWGPFPKLGVTGAAVATLTGRSIGVLYQFYRLLRGTERIRILASQIRVSYPVL